MRLTLINDDGLLRTIALNGPAALNAFSRDLFNAFTGALRGAAEDVSTRIAIVTGATGRIGAGSLMDTGNGFRASNIRYSDSALLCSGPGAVGMTAAPGCAKLQTHNDFKLQKSGKPPFSSRRDAMKTDESGIPREIATAVARFADLVAPFFPAGALRMGGGTILQARWASFSDKPLISVDGDEIQVDAEAVRKLFERAGRERSPGGLESP